MEWSIDQLEKEGPKPLKSNFSINNDLEVYIIPPSKHATVLLKEKNSQNPALYKSPVGIPMGSSPTYDSDNDYHCTVTYNGNARSNNRDYNYIKQMKHQIQEKKYKFKHQNSYENDSDSSDSNFSCISLPNRKLFDNKNRDYYNPYHPMNRPNVSYVNRSIYLPTPKIIPTPKTETRSMYLPPAPKPKPSTEKAKSGFVKSKYIF
jgi:hypothetical protein